MSERAKAIFALFLTMAIWGLAPVFTRILSVELKPANALVIRYSAVSLIFAAVLALRGAWRIHPSDRVRLLAAALIGMLGYNLGSVYGFEIVPAGMGALIIATQPLLILLLAAVVSREALTTSMICGVLVAFCGSALLLWKDLGLSDQNVSLLRGSVLIFVAGLAWAFYVVTTRPLVRKYGALPISGLSIGIATVPMLFLASPETLAVASAMNLQEAGAMVFMVILSTFIASISWNYGAARLPAAAAGAFLYLVPLIAVAAGAMILAENISTTMVLGGVLIVAGVAVAQFGERFAG